MGLGGHVGTEALHGCWMSYQGQGSTALSLQSPKPCAGTHPRTWQGRRCPLEWAPGAGVPSVPSLAGGGPDTLGKTPARGMGRKGPPAVGGTVTSKFELRQPLAPCPWLGSTGRETQKRPTSRKLRGGDAGGLEALRETRD